MTECEICGRTDKQLVVDHDHATGMIRGLLCRRCNLALAVIEQPELMRAAHVYLAKERPLREYMDVQLAYMKKKYAEDPAYRAAAKKRAADWHRTHKLKAI
jgi:hypothetical protein